MSENKNDLTSESCPGIIYHWTDITRADQWFKIGRAEDGNLVARLKSESEEQSNPGFNTWKIISLVWVPDIIKAETKIKQIYKDLNGHQNIVNSGKEWFNYKPLSVYEIKLMFGGVVKSYEEIKHNENHISDLIKKIGADHSYDPQIRCNLHKINQKHIGINYKNRCMVKAFEEGIHTSELLNKNRNAIKDEYKFKYNKTNAKGITFSTTYTISDLKYDLKYGYLELI